MSILPGRSGGDPRLVLGGRTTGWVCTTPRGERLRPDWLLRRFRDLTDQAGLPPIRLHELRDGAATLMLAAGTDVKVVQEALGHLRVSTTLDGYTSVVPELFHASVQAVAELVVGGGDSSPPSLGVGP